jgi:hypothetical protein
MIPPFELKPCSVYFSRIMVNIESNNNTNPLKENATQWQITQPNMDGMHQWVFPSMIKSGRI